MNAFCILVYIVAAVVFALRGQFWECVAFLALAELASISETVKNSSRGLY